MLLGVDVTHPDDEFHPPTNDDPFWSETAWFAFSVPERKLAGWTYPFFRTNQGTCSAAVFLWDDRGDSPFDCRYYKQLWHLPVPEQLSDCAQHVLGVEGDVGKPEKSRAAILLVAGQWPTAPSGVGKHLAVLARVEQGELPLVAHCRLGQN